MRSKFYAGVFGVAIFRHALPGVLWWATGHGKQWFWRAGSFLLVPRNRDKPPIVMEQMPLLTLQEAVAYTLGFTRGWCESMGRSPEEEEKAKQEGG